MMTTIRAIRTGGRARTGPVLPSPPEWVADALCAQTDPELFFPEKGEPARPAKKVCASCDVRAQCLAWALETQQRHGIWGGLSERERRPLRRQLTQQRRAAA